MRLSKRILELFSSHTCLTSFFLKEFDINEKIFNYLYTQNTYNVSDTKFNETEFCIRIQPDFVVESRMDDFAVIWGVRLDAQTLALLLLPELNFPCLPHRQL